ncbi:hypothetical protein VCRA2113O23_10276 [Vibrio crassostreae]|nr:hypothetical protein VCRA2113O23_10276 [Vibrio crassostreae]
MVPLLDSTIHTIYLIIIYIIKSQIIGVTSGVTLVKANLSYSSHQVTT